MKNYVKFVLKNYIFKMLFIDIITPDISGSKSSKTPLKFLRKKVF